MQPFNLSNVDHSWKEVISSGLAGLVPDYIQYLHRNPNWLPGSQHLFNAFSLPRAQVKYVLFGESPYPRQQSANGYAFWDNAVQTIWSENGLEKCVNRATSLRNFIKMLLRAQGFLSPGDTTQASIAALAKHGLITTITQLFNNMMNHGFLLLNTSLVLSDKPVRYDAQHWKPFIDHILSSLSQLNTPPCLILLGNIAHQIKKLPVTQQFDYFQAQHPYNVSFIEDPSVHRFFQPFDLLQAT
jgi:uracil-DNA glycosylase